MAISEIKGPGPYKKKTGGDGTYLSFDATDASGKVRGALFNEEVTKFGDLFEEGANLRIFDPTVAAKNLQYCADYPLNVEFVVIKWCDCGEKC